MKVRSDSAVGHLYLCTPPTTVRSDQFVYNTKCPGYEVTEVARYELSNIQYYYTTKQNNTK